MHHQFSGSSVDSGVLSFMVFCLVLETFYHAYPVLFEIQVLIKYNLYWLSKPALDGCVFGSSQDVVHPVYIQIYSFVGCGK